MDITQLLGSDLSQQVINGISSSSQATKKETASVVSAATPILLGMLKKNSESEAGASSLLGALSNHKGGILDNLGGFFNSGDTADGEGILGHILGDKKGSVEQAISTKTGVNSSKVSTILAMLAPIILGKLGSQASAKNVSSGGGLMDVIGGMMGGSGSSIGGDILSSVLGSSTGGGKKKDGLGGLLGGMFGKK